MFYKQIACSGARFLEVYISYIYMYSAQLAPVINMTTFRVNICDHDVAKLIRAHTHTHTRI